MMISSILLVGCKATAPFSDPQRLDEPPSLLEATSAAEVSKSDVQKLLDGPIFTNTELTNTQLFALSDAQIKDFTEYFNASNRQHIKPHLRFYDYLESELSSFSYHGETYTAQQALALSSGNCMSLAIVTTALAQLAGLDISYQKVDSRPVYSKRDGITLLSSHVRTKVYEPLDNDANTIVFKRANIIIDYFPTSGDVKGRRVLDNEFMAMYYQNMAAESLINRQFDRAYAYIQKGIEVFPAHPETLNLLAILYKRSKQLSKAIEVFEFMQSNNIESLNATENYASLLRGLNQDKKADDLLSGLEGINDDNPYRWLSIAEQHYDRGEYRVALRYSLKASKIAPYLHEPHFLMAKVFHKQLKSGASLKAIRKAGELAGRNEDRARYLAKLKVLKSES